MKLLNKIKLAVCVFLISFMGSSCVSALAFSADKEKDPLPVSPLRIINIIESEGPHELNPQLTSLANDIQLLTGLYEGLFTYNPKSLVPQYAIAVEYKISRDKKRWTFTINPEARFSNGEKITASNVRDSWLQLLSSEGAPYASMLDVIEGAEAFRNGSGSEDNVGIYALSDSQLMIHLVKPANYLPKILCHPAFSVIHRNPTVYSGPFIIEDIGEKQITLTQNPYYWDKANVNPLVINFIQSNDAEENAFYYNTGMADWITTSVSTDKVINKTAFQLNAEFATTYMFFKVQTEDNKDYLEADVWDYPEFRQALLEAVPWDLLRKKAYFPATTLVYPLGDYPTVEGFSFTDEIEAVKLMEAAKEKYNIPKDQKLTVTMEIIENSISMDELGCLYLAWQKIGVELQVRTLPSYLYFGNVPKSTADILLYTWIGDFADPLAFLELFRGDSTLNDSGYRNELFDQLLDKAAAASDKESNDYLAQAENLLLDSYMIIPIDHPVSFNLIDLNEIGGWYGNAFDIHPLKYLFKKEVPVTLPNVVLNK